MIQMLVTTLIDWNLCLEEDPTKIQRFQFSFLINVWS